MESLADSPTQRVQRLVARLRFRHLALLVALERHGSLRAAAQVLGLTQPALSKALGEIEIAFGARLFTRTARGLLPTTHGGIAIRGAKRLLEELAIVGAEATAGNAVTVIRVGAPPFVAQGHLPAILADLFHDDRAIRVELVEDRVPLLLEALLVGRLDALVTSLPVEAPADRQLRYEKLFDAAFEVIAPHGHPLTRMRRVAWTTLARERWIMPAAGAMVRRVVEDRFRLAGLVAPQPVVESTSPVTNARLVAAGIGLCVVPSSTLLAGHDAGRVDRVRAHPAIPPYPVALVHRKRADDRRVDLLREAIARRLGGSRAGRRD